jgi:CheY-like chemotaxis protein
MKSNPQVLLIDRNVSDVKVVRDTLGSAGLEIHVRASASAALSRFMRWSRTS